MRNTKLTNQERIAAVKEYLDGKSSLSSIANKYGIAESLFVPLSVFTTVGAKMHYVLPPRIPIIHQNSSARLWKPTLPAKAVNKIFAIDSIFVQELNSRIGSSCIMVIMIFGRIAAMGVRSL